VKNETHICYYKRFHRHLGKKVLS